MISDARTLPANASVEAGICIIGAGPIGMTLALELASLGREVLLLDAGGQKDSPARNALAAPAAGFRYGTEKTIIQHQRLGGNAHAWHVRTPAAGDLVRFADYQAADFEDRPDLAGDAWPFRKADLQCAARRAGELWDIGPGAFSPPEGVPDLGPDLAHAAYRFPSSRTVTQDFRDRIEASLDVRVLLKAPVAELEFEGGRAVRARIKVAADREIMVSAGRFVLACGTLNACRLLFNSRQGAGHAPGNKHDVLGRYLMDHPGIHGGVFYPSDRKLIDTLAPYDIHDAEGTPAMAHAILLDARLLEGGVLGLASHFFPRARSWKWDHVPSHRRNDGVLGAIAIRRAIERNRPPKLREVINTAAGIDAVVPHLLQRSVTPPSSMGRGGWSRRSGAAQRYSVCEVIQSAEQAPHADNRVLPSGETDAMGQKRITLDWRWHESDQQKVIAAQRVFEASVAASGLGRIDHARPDGRLRIVTTSSHHHIGGLRMGREARTSVTDGNCLVRDTENLFVAGAGLFPTGSYANPTWLAAVLAVRLAWHLAGRAGAVATEPAGLVETAAPHSW